MPPGLANRPSKRDPGLFFLLEQLRIIELNLCEQNRMSGAFRSRGPKPLSEVLSALMGARGYGRLKGRRDLETAWETAVGEQVRRPDPSGRLATWRA